MPIIKSDPDIDAIAQLKDIDGLHEEANAVVRQDPESPGGDDSEMQAFNAGVALAIEAAGRDIWQVRRWMEEESEDEPDDVWHFYFIGTREHVIKRLEAIENA